LDYNYIQHENLLGLQKSLPRYPLRHSGLPFVAPLVRGVVVFPAAFIGALWTLQYGLTSNIYYDEYNGEARETERPKLH
jgi:hypothetical protein